MNLCTDYNQLLVTYVVNFVTFFYYYNIVLIKTAAAIIHIYIQGESNIYNNINGPYIFYLAFGITVFVFIELLKKF